ncbi:MAG: WG repeat-containing protein, partial [Planctomycetota bacterium]|nr:WG repeat-containing protein [Planctomycetota bacterium]
ESAVHFSDGVAVVWLDSPDSWGVIDMEKTLVARFGGDRLIDWVGDFADGLAPASDLTLSGYIGRDGKFATQPQFLSCGPFSEGLAVVQVRGRSGFDPSGGSKTVAVVDGFGYADKAGKVVIEPKFDLACEFKNGVAIAGAPGKFERPGALGTFEGRPVLSEVGYRIGFIDKTGQWLDKPPASDADMKIAFFRVGADGRLEPADEADLTERVVVEVTCATPRKVTSISVELGLGDAAVTVDAKAMDDTGTRFRTEPVDLAAVLAGSED